MWHRRDCHLSGHDAEDLIAGVPIVEQLLLRSCMRASQLVAARLTGRLVGGCSRRDALAQLRWMTTVKTIQEIRGKKALATIGTVLASSLENQGRC